MASPPPPAKRSRAEPRPCDEGPPSVTAFIDRMNAAYEAVHVAYEDDFWATKMALGGASVAALNASKAAYEAFLRDASLLAEVRAAIATAAPSAPSAGQLAVLAVMERTFTCYIMEDEGAAAIRDQTATIESALEHARANMKLGYTPPSNAAAFVPASSVLLRTTMGSHEDPAVRRACYAGLRSIGSFVAPDLCRLVALRNRLARSLGFADFYDMKVTQAEGFGKDELFAVLSPLEERTRPLMEEARAALAAAPAHGLGAAALEPWNQPFAQAGASTAAQDPYFPFAEAVPRWARTFAALGIGYRGATMRLDLCDRDGKYSNGFCHWPQPAFRGAGGGWVPSRANFTSLATPGAVGSGATALSTLLHEGGHAAHFANILQDSPFFSQERAPTSVAYAENQSMFLDKLVGDAAWIGRYAEDASGEGVLPWGLLEAKIRSTHAYRVFGLRSMLAVPFFEKALYELPEGELSAARVEALADEVEARVCGGASPRPLLSVPHIISDEASCYYHGYVLADMSVHQTRAHFLARHPEQGIVDNPAVGRRLADVYWAPGNSVGFLELVERMTGAPLKADAWVDTLRVPLEERLASERAAYDAAVAVRAARKKKEAAEQAAQAQQEGGQLEQQQQQQQDLLAQLDMRMLLVHGDEVVADSALPEHGGFEGCCARYREWLQKKF